MPATDREKQLFDLLGPPTYYDPYYRDTFCTTGDCVLNRFMYPLRESVQELPYTKKNHKRSMSALCPGSHFDGHQFAGGETKKYPVQVQINDIDLKESMCCGYLTIHGLTNDHPSLTTFFEAEIIGSKYSFNTQKWDTDWQTDRKHWERFPYYVQHCKHYANDPGHQPSYDIQQHNVIFMRWKERFLVPDHRVESIDGASYEGFYYIAYDKRSQVISGYYHHRKSEDFQRLELSLIPSKSSPSFSFC